MTGTLPRTLLLLMLSAMAATAGCGEPAPPEVDVTGIWRGTWQGQDGAETGFCTIKLHQQGAEVTGKIFLRYDVPSLKNVGVALLGTVEASTLRFQMQSSDNPHSFEGEVAAGAVSGSIDYGPNTGTWQASAMNAQTLTSASSFKVSDSIRSMTFAEGKLWYNNGYMLHQVDPSGAELSSVLSEGDCQGGVAFDGTHLLCAGPEILLLDFQGKNQGSIKVGEYWARTLAFDGQHLWVGDGMSYTLHQADLSGKELSAMTVKASYGDLAYGLDHLWQLQNTPPVVFKIDRAGAVVAAYFLPAELGQVVGQVWSNPTGLAFDGQDLWVGEERSDFGAMGPDSMSNHVHRLTIP